MDADIAAGELRATVTSEGKYGWCGLAQLAHTAHADDWLLSPAFTLEHYIGIPSNSSGYIEYEPCVSRKRLANVTADGCTLHYAPLSCSQIECVISYQLVAPHFVDVVVTAQTQRSDWPLGYVALFFATIVRAPIYTGINFLGEDEGIHAKDDTRWIHFNSFAWHVGNVAHPAGLQRPELPRLPDAPKTYYYSDSSVRFDQPFFYAHVEEMAFALMFRPQDKEHVRFVVNPLAPAFGGPAWDFFWVINQPIVGRAYKLSFRSIFKPFDSRDDARAEYNAFIPS